MELGRLGELIEKMAQGGEGVTVMPIRKGMPQDPTSDRTYERDGWVVGYITPNQQGDLTTGRTIPEAVEAVFDHLDAEAEAD
jgi:hypothetical protein